MRPINIFWIYATILLILAGCQNNDKETPSKPVKQPPVQKEIIVNAPVFDPDTAYLFINKQVDFGPRVPGTESHIECRNWLVNQLGTYAGPENVKLQKGRAKLFNGKAIDFYNITASFNPEINNRVLLFAHWDTRMFADHDQNPNKRTEPVLGANDGGSGTGVLLEIARHLNQTPLSSIGIDIVLFDAEDQGTPDNMGYQRTVASNETWCLGSQYWSRNRPGGNSRYLYGILLDMVGGRNATFPKEAHSLTYAGRVLDKVWKEAQDLGYGNYFLNAPGNPVLDDHYFVNTVASIPTIDILDYNVQRQGFNPTWHTHDDNMDNISKESLKAVGQTVLQVIYKEDAIKKGA